MRDAGWKAFMMTEDITGFPSGASSARGKTAYTELRPGEILLCLPGMLGVPFFSCRPGSFQILISPLSVLNSAGMRSGFCCLGTSQQKQDSSRLTICSIVKKWNIAAGAKAAAARIKDIFYFRMLGFVVVTP